MTHYALHPLVWAMPTWAMVFAFESLAIVKDVKCAALQLELDNRAWNSCLSHLPSRAQLLRVGGQLILQMLMEVSLHCVQYQRIAQRSAYHMPIGMQCYVLQCKQVRPVAGLASHRV